MRRYEYRYFGADLLCQHFFVMLFWGTPITYALGGAGTLAMLAAGMKMSLVIKSVLSDSPALRCWPFSSSP